MTINDDDSTIPPPPTYPPPPSTPVEDLEIQSTPVLERLNKEEAVVESNRNHNTTKHKKKYLLGLIILLVLLVGAGVGAALGILLPQRETNNDKTNDVELGIYQVLDGDGNVIDFTPSTDPSQSPSITTIPSLSPSHIPTHDPTAIPSSSPTESRSLSFFAIGDVPYSDLEACLLPHELDKAANSDTDAKFMVHLGDIRDGKPFQDWEFRGGDPRPCPEYLFEDVATIFENSHVPTFFSMGDNAWLDCEDVDESYSFWEKHLLTFDERKDLDWPELGATVSRNEDHIEMYSFVLKDVLVIGQGLPGEGRGVDHAWVQYNVYLDENARWLEKSFAENEFKAVVINGNSSKGWNERYLLRLEEVARRYKDIPIMFLGDGHDFEEETKFRGLPNLHRIALDDVVTPTLITVDPYATGNLNVFTYDRRCPCAGNHRPTQLFNYTSGVCAGVCETNGLCINENAESVLWGEE
jgi:hypothetical protein